MIERKEQIERYKEVFKSAYLKPSEDLGIALSALGTAPLTAAQSLSNLLKRPEVGLSEVLLWGKAPIAKAKLGEISMCEKTKETLEIEVKYEGYISIQQDEIRRLSKMKESKIPESFGYEEVVGLSTELKEKLSQKRPQSLAEAAKIPGVTPAALTALLFHLKKGGVAHERSV
jgi:tRNA uridine 5-carboxymethylaminomethyl modification enzyme